MNQKRKSQLRKSRYKKKSARPEYLPSTVQRETQKRKQRRGRKRFRLKPQITIGGIIILVLLIVLAGSRLFLSGTKAGSDKAQAVSSSNAKKTKGSKKEKDLVEMEESKEIFFEPHCVDSTKPENLISYTNIEVDGNLLENVADYKPDEDITFNVGQEYTNVDGIVTFRGNSFRDNPTYGYANMTNYKLNKLWSADTGSQTTCSAVWTGSGRT